MHSKYSKVRSPRNQILPMTMIHNGLTVCCGLVKSPTHRQFLSKITINVYDHCFLLQQLVSLLLRSLVHHLQLH